MGNSEIKLPLQYLYIYSHCLYLECQDILSPTGGRKIVPIQGTEN